MAAFRSVFVEEIHPEGLVQGHAAADLGYPQLDANLERRRGLSRLLKSQRQQEREHPQYFASFRAAFTISPTCGKK